MNRDEIVAILGQHEYEFGFVTNCSCGEPGIWFWSDYQQHMADVFIAANGER